MTRPRSTSLAADRRDDTAEPSRSPEVVRLVRRLLYAQAGASTAVSLSFGRRTVSSVLLAVLVAAALCGLAALLRPASHAVWLTAVTAQAAFIAVGLYQFTYARYLGGTLLAIISFGTLLHPAVARAFSAETGALAESLVSESSS